MTQTLEIERDTSAASAARSWLADVLERSGVLSEPARADLLVMASELVANVMAHTASKPRVSISGDDDEVRVEVSDDDPRLPKVQSAGADRIGGNGLRIVDAWSRRWGVDLHHAGGKTVWFTVAIPSG